MGVLKQNGDYGLGKAEEYKPIEEVRVHYPFKSENSSIIDANRIELVSSSGRY